MKTIFLLAPWDESESDRRRIKYAAHILNSEKKTERCLKYVNEENFQLKIHQMVISQKNISCRVSLLLVFLFQDKYALVALEIKFRVWFGIELETLSSNWALRREEDDDALSFLSSRLSDSLAGICLCESRTETNTKKKIWRLWKNRNFITKFGVVHVLCYMVKLRSSQKFVAKYKKSENCWAFVSFRFETIHIVMWTKLLKYPLNLSLWFVSLHLFLIKMNSVFYQCRIPP